MECSVQKSSRLLGLRVLQAESVSITRVQGRLQLTASEPKGSDQLLAAPFLLQEGDWVEKVHRHLTTRDKQLTGDRQRELCDGLGFPIFPIFPSQLSLLLGDIFFVGGRGSSYKHSLL